MHLRKRVLVTGGAGFLGSHLCERLLNEGCDVLCVVNFYTGSKRNIENLLSNPYFELCRHDITFPLYLEVDEIYNLACPASPIHYQNDPVQTTKVNVHGSINMLGLAKRIKAKILQASTSEVYGKVMDGNNCCLLTEDTDRLMGSTSKRRWAYACSKALDEFLALAYFEEKKLQVVIARLFNTVGPRQTGQYGMVIPNFVQKALIDKPIVVHGDGTQSRSFTHVSDVVDALISLMAEHRAVGQVVNVGSTEEVTIKELAHLIKEMAESDSDIEYISYEKAYGPGFEDMKRRCPDINRIKELIGFQPKVDLRSIIQSVIDYYKE